MKALAILVILAGPLAASAMSPPPSPDATTLAKELLTKGADLFDAKDANGLAATYVDDARLELVGKNEDAHTYDVQTKQGREEIAQFYRDVWKDDARKRTSRNTVEFARLVEPDLLVVHGTFQPNVDDARKYSFVQERIKQDDRWRILTLRIYFNPNN